MREVSQSGRSVHTPGASQQSSRTPAAQEETTPAIDHDESPSFSSSTASRPRILLIEDEVHAREALALLLDYYGYDVIAASDGTEGLASVTDVSPDLVVTDWLMPGLSGRALCIALRERRQTMPIIVITSAEEVFSHDQPVNARLRKPIDPSLLNYVIVEELHGLAREES